MSVRAQPIAASERIASIDVVRGFALLGIFIMNMPDFHASYFAGADGSHLWNAWWDRSAETIRDVLFSGKFNSMFSLLFAVGFTIQLERMEQREPDRAKQLYLRRLAWLFVFGAVHAIVLWPGDILHMYAFFGLFLLALRRVPDRVRWILFGACILFTPVMGVLRVLIATPEAVQLQVATEQAWEASNNLAYGRGSLFDGMRERVGEMLFVYSDPDQLRFMAYFYVQIFTTTLLGLWLGRHRFFQETGRHLETVRKAQWWALGIGLATGTVFGAWAATVENPGPTPFGVLANTCYVVCRLSIMIFYVATIVRAVHSEKWGRRLAPMGVIGRMPLTIYLGETLIATAIFHGWGLGLWGKVGPALDLVLAFAIFFLVLLPFARWWLRRFSLGPMEYLWRVLTYGRIYMRGGVTAGVREA
jgi:uncharacterized protein